MKEPEIRQIEDFIKHLDENDLRYLNRLIVERIRLKVQEASTVAMARFNIGERVCFTAPDGLERYGHIIRLNTKTISVETVNGEQWKVAPALLREARRS